MQKYADLVDVFISEKDHNANEACNKGILLARGKYIKPLLDDDAYYGDAMEKAVEVMEEHPEVDMLVCGGTKEVHGRIFTSYLPPGVNYGKDATDVFKYRAAASFGHFVRRKSHALRGLMSVWAGDIEYVMAFIKNGGNVKFCRVKMYHHTQSVISPEIYVERHQLCRDIVYSTMKSSVPRVWYYKYRFNKFIKTNPILYRGAQVYWKCAGAFLKLRRQEPKAVSFKKKEKDYVWDGGFS